MKYPNATTKKCGKCGRTFTCKGEGWTPNRQTKKCPFQYETCYCQKCNPMKRDGGHRGEGCEEVELREEVQFT